MYYKYTAHVKGFCDTFSVKSMESQENSSVDSEQKPTPNHPDPLPSVPPVEPKPKSPPPQEPATAQQLEEAKEKMSSFERSTLRWARVAVVVSGFAFLVVCGQLWEMHSGGVDTHNLAVAASNQAVWTQNLATNMQTQADRTKDLADRMKVQADQVSRLADATERSNQIDTDSERPWIGLSDYIVQNFEAGQIPAITLSLLNTGRRPARAFVNTGFEYASASRDVVVFVRPASSEIVLPGQPMNDRPILLPIRPDYFLSDNLKFIIYIQVSYTDVQTGKTHITHACIQRPVHPVEGGILSHGGFSACDTYWDAN